MSPIESTGAATLARGSPGAAQPSFSARSGADKAQVMQSAATVRAAAPVETAQVVVQAQAAQKSRLTPQPQPLAGTAQSASRQPSGSLSKPMTAVLLHELRLQQELADVQEEKADKPAR